MSCLIIELGNRSIKAALTDGVTIGKTFLFTGPQRLDTLICMMENEHPLVAVTSSKLVISDDVLTKLKRRCPDILVIDPAHSSVQNHYGLPSNLTYGRTAAVIASRYLFQGSSCTIINTGKTREIDFIDKSGDYIGGISGTKFDIEACIGSRKSDTIVFAGTEANNLAKRRKNSIFAVRNLILMGLALITDDYVKRDYI